MSLVEDNEKEDIAVLPESSYPATITTDECELMTESKLGNRYFVCDIETNPGSLGTYHRNFQNKSQDKFYVMVHSEVDKNKTFCYYVNNYYLPEEVVYRNVNLSNIFPSTTENRIVGENWRTQIAQDYKDEVETYAKDNGDYQYYETHLEYSYTLSQSALEKVREYNNRVKDYKNDDTIELDTVTGNKKCKKIDNKYFECKSSFITDIESASNTYGIVNNRTGHTRGVSDYTVLKEKNGS